MDIGGVIMTSEHFTDEDLIINIQNGSIEHFEIFYERYFPFVYKIVYSMLKNESDTLDLCHDLFIEYYEKAGSFQQHKGSVKAWIAIRAKSRTIDFLRKKKRVILKDELIYEEKNKEEQKLVEDRVISKLEREKLKGLLEKLPPLQRHAIYLNYELSLSHKETSKVLNKPLGTVKSLIRYGIQNLRKNFTSNGYERGDHHDS